MKNKDLLEEITSGRILYDIAQHISSILGCCDKSEFEPTKLCVVGSRITGHFKKGSDLDIALQYQGTLREDDVFSALNSESLLIEDIPVDFIPYCEGRGNSIDLEESYISLFRKED